MFILPVAAADALARLALRAIHIVIDEPQIGERHSMRRHRGVYIWRPAMDQPDPELTNALIDLRERKTETEGQKRTRKAPH
jgi:hypothetical protein